MNEPKFLDKPPDHSYEPTCDFKWIARNISVQDAIDRKCEFVAILDPVLNPVVFYREVILCQRFQGTFKDVWVRVPVA